MRAVLRAAAVAVGVLMLATACHGSSPAPGPTSSGPAPAAQPLSPAWTSVLSQIKPDGTVSTQTALQAFALTFGPLPGVTVPAGDPGVMPDGTFALRWLTVHWADITQAQRDAAVALLPELAALNGGTARAGLAQAPAHVNAAPAVLARATPLRSDFFYTQLAMQIAGDIAAKLNGKTLTLDLKAYVGQTQEAKDLAATMVLDSNGLQQGAPTRCEIIVAAKGDALLGDDLAQTMAHEVWHCFQAQYSGHVVSPAASWIIEGEAEWVGDALYPDGHQVAGGNWLQYLMFPDVPVFTRAYDAVGFYSQLAQAGGDVWSKLIPILNATDNEDAFDVAGGNGDTFQNLWASGFARDKSRGDPWDMQGPAIPPWMPSPEVENVDNGSAVQVGAFNHATNLYQLNATADVILVVIDGSARISDGAGNDYLVQGQSTYCHRDAGCDCPDGTQVQPPPLTLPGQSILLGVAGDAEDAGGSVTGVSLDDFCKKKTLSGTWKGTWHDPNPEDDYTDGTFTLTWTQTGNTLAGTIQVTGTPCITQGTVTGQLNGKTITFGAVQGERTITYTGQVSTNGNTMSGTYNAPVCSDATGPWSAQRQ